jgi:hypothetical protein
MHRRNFKQKYIIANHTFLTFRAQTDTIEMRIRHAYIERASDGMKSIRQVKSNE